MDGGRAVAGRRCTLLLRPAFSLLRTCVIPETSLQSRHSALAVVVGWGGFRQEVPQRSSIADVTTLKTCMQGAWSLRVDRTRGAASAAPLYSFSFLDLRIIRGRVRADSHPRITHSRRNVEAGTPGEKIDSGDRSFLRLIMPPGTDGVRTVPLVFRECLRGFLEGVRCAFLPSAAAPSFSIFPSPPSRSHS